MDGRRSPVYFLRRFLMEAVVTIPSFRVLAVALALVAGMLSTTERASALSFREIEGTWCGPVVRYTFERRALKVYWIADRNSRTFRVISYDYGNDDVTIYWMRDDKEYTTTFSDFNGDTMAQLQNDAGPRREFRRCNP